MSSFLEKIKKFFTKTKNRNTILLASFFVFISLFLLIDFANAQTPSTWDFKGAIIEAITSMLLGISGFFIKITVWISQLFIVIASYNNFINSNAVILGWVLVRDIVNMFFVIILLVIAFGTVLGLEQYEWKKLLVKLVFAAVLVNFSRIICGVIIDVSQVFMMTFVNGFAATAGGNVINGLNLNKIYNLSTNADPKTYTNNVDLLVTGIAAVFFGSISMFVLGAYLIVILARVVSLWVLIILSPIAFMSSVLPATQKYASEWWKEFNNNVLAGPLLAFFFWLSFAIVGGGNSFQEVLPEDASKKYEVDTLFGSTATGAAEAMDWGAMASFAVAIALLMTGVKKTQELGVTGAGALSSAMSMAKKVGMYASGAKLAGWAGQKTWGGIKKQAKNIGGDLKDMAQLRGMAFLERSYDKELTTGKKGFWARRTDSFMEREKLRSARQKQIEARKGILDSQIGTTATYEAKFETESLKYNLSQREAAKQAGMPAILQEVEGKFRQNDAHQKLIENLNTKKREATQINIEREQAEKQERINSEAKYKDKIKKDTDLQTELKMAPVEEQVAGLEGQAVILKRQAEEKASELDSVRKSEEKEIKGYEDTMKELLRLIEEVREDKNRPVAEKQAEIQRLEESVYDFQGMKDYAEEHHNEKFYKDNKARKEESLESQITTLKADADSFKNRAGEIRLEVEKIAEVDVAAGNKEFARRRRIADMGIKLDDQDMINQQDELKEKGKAYERSGELARAMAMFAASENLANKKESEAFGGMKQNQRVAVESQLVSEIKKVEGAMKKMIDINSAGYKDSQKILNKLQRQKSALSSYNSGASGESSRDAMVSCLNEVGWFDKEGEVNMDNRLRAVLSQHLGKHVKQGEEQEAAKEFRGRFTSEGEFQAAMETIADNFKKAGMGGDLTKVGLISEEIDKATGKLKYAWKEKPDNSAANLDYYVTRGKFDKLSTLGSIDKDGIMCGISGEGLKQLETIFKGKTDVNLSHKDFNTIFSSLNEAKIDKSNAAQFEKLITTIKGSVKQEKKVFEAVTQRVAKLQEKINKAK